MKLGLNRVCRVVALAALCLAAGATSPVTSSCNSNPGLEKKNAGVADMGNATRLRKLHLVRPDLIPYPMYIDVYC
jgi:hypothetical protein